MMHRVSYSLLVVSSIAFPFCFGTAAPFQDKSASRDVHYKGVGFGTGEVENTKKHKEMAAVSWAVVGPLGNSIAGVQQPADSEVVEEYLWQQETRKRRVLVLDLGEGVKLELVRIKAGVFQMGSPDSDSEAPSAEKPQHEVEITKDFYIGKFEVTRLQFARFIDAASYETEAEKDGGTAIGYNSKINRFESVEGKYSWRNPGFFQTDQHPAATVTWNDAVEFCQWASKKTGKRIALPTEAQWEYASRGGTQTRYFTGREAERLMGFANVADKTLKAKGIKWLESWDSWSDHISFEEDGYAFTSPVGTFHPNGFGLYDMIGNVWEWCADSYNAKEYSKDKRTDPKGPPGKAAHRVLRGGSWFPHPIEFDWRCALRRGYPPNWRNFFDGFRVVVILED